MDFIRRLFGVGDESEPLPPEAFELVFPNAQIRPAVRVLRGTNPQAIIQSLELPQPTPTIFLSGGEDLMDTRALISIRSVIEDGLARFLQNRGVSLIDGGIAQGAMLLVGVARQRRGYRFPLVGVAPDQLVAYPGVTHEHAYGALDAAHSHFVLTDGTQFGGDSETIINLAYALSGFGAEKRLALVLSGGESVRREAHRCSTVAPRFPLLVLESSGRFADELAAARTTVSTDPLVREILDQGIVHFIPVKAGADNLYRWLENFFED